MPVSKQEMKDRIKEGYSRLNHLFRIYKKPNAEMRKIQHEVWELKRNLRGEKPIFGGLCH